MFDDIKLKLGTLCLCTNKFVSATSGRQRKWRAESQKGFVWKMYELVLGRNLRIIRGVAAFGAPAGALSFPCNVTSRTEISWCRICNTHVHMYCAQHESGQHDKLYTHLVLWVTRCMCYHAETCPTIASNKNDFRAWEHCTYIDPLIVLPCAQYLSKQLKEFTETSRGLHAFRERERDTSLLLFFILFNCKLDFSPVAVVQQ
jgi:hypothetical protein